MTNEIIKKAPPLIKDIEVKLYQLCGQIDYGEISNIETYWMALIASVENLSKLVYNKTKNNKLLADALLPHIGLAPEELISMTREFQSSCEGGGSSGSIDTAKIEELQEKSITFEKIFLIFIKQLRKTHVHAS